MKRRWVGNMRKGRGIEWWSEMEWEKESELGQNTDGKRGGDIHHIK